MSERIKRIKDQLKKTNEAIEKTEKVIAKNVKASEELKIVLADLNKTKRKLEKGLNSKHVFVIN